MLLELELVIIIGALVGGLGFCVGSYISPVTKHLKHHIRFLEGKVNRYKQDMNEKKEYEKDGLDSIIEGNPAIKAIVSALGGKEKALNFVLSKIDLSKVVGGQQEKPSGGQVYT